MKASDYIGKRRKREIAREREREIERERAIERPDNYIKRD